MPVWAIVLLVIAGVLILAVVGIVAWAISVYNSLIRLKNNVEESFSTMDVYMKKRYDLIPNFVETVKAVAKHEKETLESVMKARYSAMNATTTAEQAKNENFLTQTLGRLFQITESYPQLQANQNFLQLQGELQNLEDEIASTRKYYNGCVKIYNNRVQMFPSNLIANRYKFEKATLFEIENKEERKAPKVKF